MPHSTRPADRLTPRLAYRMLSLGSPERSMVMERILCIVSRHKPLLYGSLATLLSEQLGDGSYIEIVLDRRRGEPRPEAREGSPDERRRQPAVEEALRSRGFAIVASEAGRHRAVAPEVLEEMLARLRHRARWRRHAELSHRLPRPGRLLGALAIAVAALLGAWAVGSEDAADLVARASAWVRLTLAEMRDRREVSPRSAGSLGETGPGSAPASLPSHPETGEARTGALTDETSDPTQPTAEATPRVPREAEALASLPPGSGEVSSETAETPASTPRRLATDRGATAVAPQLPERPPFPPPAPREPAPALDTARWPVPLAEPPRIDVIARPRGEQGLSYSVHLSDPAGRPLSGAEVSIEGRTPDGARFRQLLQPGAAQGTYETTLHAADSRRSSLRLRILLGNQRVDLPLTD